MGYEGVGGIESFANLIVANTIKKLTITKIENVNVAFCTNRRPQRRVLIDKHVLV